MVDSAARPRDAEELEDCNHADMQFVRACPGGRPLDDGVGAVAELEALLVGPPAVIERPLEQGMERGALETAGAVGGGPFGEAQGSVRARPARSPVPRRQVARRLHLP
jgi:hypothetical protein